MVRYRFIVSRDNEKLYDHLVRSLADFDEVEVVVDRRLTPTARDRRPAERRVHQRVQEDLRLFGWAFARVDRPAARP